MYKSKILLENLAVEESCLEDIKQIQYMDFTYRGMDIKIEFCWPAWKPVYDLPCIIHSNALNTINNEPNKDLAFYLAENAFYHLFLIVNLAFPNSLDMYDAYCVTRYSNRTYKHKLGLSASMFGFRRNGWPNTKTLPIDICYKWFKSLNIGIRQISQTNIERALFSLLHVAHQQHGINPTDIIWIAHALEALYDTPNNSVSKILKDRIFLVLGSPKDLNKYKRKIDEFYIMRSRLVHGDMEIISPCNNSLFDIDFDDFVFKMIESIDFGTKLVVATIQKMILEGWTNIGFRESLVLAGNSGTGHEKGSQ